MSLTASTGIDDSILGKSPKGMLRNLTLVSSHFLWGIIAFFAYLGHFVNLLKMKSTNIQVSRHLRIRKSQSK
jgi:hypothetical protein